MSVLEGQKPAQAYATQCVGMGLELKTKLVMTETPLQEMVAQASAMKWNLDMTAFRKLTTQAKKSTLLPSRPINTTLFAKSHKRFNLQEPPHKLLLPFLQQ